MTRTVFSMLIGRSNYLLTYLIITHAVMLAVVLCVLGLSVWAITISLMVIVSFIHYCRLYQWSNSERNIINLDRNKGNKWTMFHYNGEQLSELVLTDSVVTQYFILLNFRVPARWRRSAVIIMNDAVDEEQFRQLRVYCREPKTFQQ